MKAILRSVQPQWMAKILTGEKTVEIGKTMPKCKLPIEVYLYETLGKFRCGWVPYGDEGNYKARGVKKKFHEGRGKVVAKFTLRCVSIVTIDRAYDETSEHFARKARLKINEVLDYANGRDTYAWHISNLTVFDKPMELGEFTNCMKWQGNKLLWKKTPLTRPPRSWQYVEVEG